MSVDAINPAVPYGTSFDDIIAGENLTGDALMFFITTRLNSLDSDINTLMGMQSDVIEKKEALAAYKNMLTALEAANEKKGGKYDKEFEAGGEIIENFKENDFPAKGSPGYDIVAGALEDLEADMRIGSKDDRYTRASKVEIAIASIDSAIAEINGESELAMIRLQQIMGQRQTAIQLTTGILQKYNAGQEAIVGNIR
jgi:hypothetical protein